MFGAKIQLAVAMQRRPVPIYASVAPAGAHDLGIARQQLFGKMRQGERALGDPGYLGEPERIYAPPRGNMQSYVEEEDKAELTLQRRVEQANKMLKRFKILGTTYRKGAVRAFPDIELVAPVVVRLVFWDVFLNQEHAGKIHMSGPRPDPVSWRKGEVRDEIGRVRHERRNIQAMLQVKPTTGKSARRQRALQRVGVTLKSGPRKQSRRTIIVRRRHIGPP